MRVEKKNPKHLHIKFIVTSHNSGGLEFKMEILFCKDVRPRCTARLMHNDFGSDLEPRFQKEPFVPYKNTILKSSSIPWKKILVSS